MTDLEKYDSHQNPPDWAKKEIKAGNLKGFTDINPQFRIDALTAVYGLCGFGWKTEIVSCNQESHSTGEISVHIRINLYIFDDKSEKWSEPIPGFGGSMMVNSFSSGVKVNDECYKMAYTDAMSVCCKMIGIGAGIYRGELWNSKYGSHSPEPQKTTETPKQPEAKPEEPAKVMSTPVANNNAPWVADKDIDGIVARIVNGESMESVLKDYKCSRANREKISLKVGEALKAREASQKQKFSTPIPKPPMTNAPVGGDEFPKPSNDLPF